MELLLILSAFTILPATIVGAGLGWRALSAHPMDSFRLAVAVGLVFAPWIGILVSGGVPDALGLLAPSALGGVMLSSPLVGTILLAWWGWRRFQPRQSVPAALAGVKQQARHTWSEPAFQPTASLADLRFPNPKATFTAVVIVAFFVGVLIAPPWRRPRSEWDFGPVIFEMFASAGTLIVSILASLCALAFAIRRAPFLAAAYSVMALCVVLGHVTLLIVGYWRAAARDSDLHYGYASTIAAASVVAITPALASHVMHLVRRRSELKDDFVDWLYRLTR